MVRFGRLKSGNWAYCFLLLLFFGNIVAHAQIYNFSNYSLEDGLPHSRTDAIAQDEKGYLWVAHQLGISKFDGFNFANFNVKDGLADNKTYSMLLLNHKHIMFGHDKGKISVLKDGKITSAELDSSAGIVFNFFINREGELWIGTERKGAYKFSEAENLIGKIKSKNFENYNETNGLSRTVTSFAETQMGFLIITDLGIKSFNKFRRDFPFVTLEGLPFDEYTSIASDSSGTIWIGTLNNGVFYKKADENLFQSLKIKDERINLSFISRIMVTSRNEVYIGTWGSGLLIVDSLGNQLHLSEDNGLAEDKVRCLYEDREGNIWIGSHQNGMSCYKGNDFSLFLKGKDNKNNQVNALIQSQDKSIYVGTNSGLYEVKKTAQYEVKKVLLYDIDEAFEITSLQEDQEGNIWIGTRGRGLIIYNPKTKQSNSLASFVPFTEKYINKIFKDRNNNIWIGSLSGISKVDQGIKSIKTYNKKDGLSGINIIEIFETNAGQLWVLPENQPVNVFENNRFSLLQPKGEKNIHGIVDIASNNGKIWLATDGDGLYLYENETLSKVNFENSAISNYINLVMAENENQLWLGTNKGLIHYNISDQTFRVYDKSGKNARIETKIGASLRSGSGELWFGTINGLLKFEAERQEVNKTPVNIDITSIQIHFRDTVLEKNVKLNHKNNHITFHFNGICFKDPSKVKYMYRLVGFDKEWQMPTSNNFITYSNLSPDKYIFEVKASNNDGIWNENSIVFPFEISPPFYLTWWFFLVSGIFIFLVIVGYIKFRERQLKKEKKHLEQIVKKRTNEILHQKEEIEKQRDELEFNSVLIKQKNLAITDSIQYARRIQLASLPDQEKMLLELGDAFIFYRPKDIVSGDFYAFTQWEDKIIVATADCTGHGVPGAFMSMIGTNIFNQIVKEKKIIKPSEILDQLNDGIQNALKQGQTDNHDGMDVAICTINFKNRVVDFSGANRPLWILKSSLIHENDLKAFDHQQVELYEDRLLIIKPDKMPIGGVDRTIEVSFTNHTLQLEKGDLLLLFTDGYADQFGGANNKKMLSRRLKELLMDIADKPTKEISNSIQDYFDLWKGDQEQVDDVLIIGVRM